MVRILADQKEMAVLSSKKTNGERNIPRLNIPKKTINSLFMKVPAQNEGYLIP